MEALNVYLEKEGVESFGTKDSDFLFDPDSSGPGRVLAVLRKMKFPEEIHILAKLPNREKPLVVYDGAKWRDPKLPNELTLSVVTPLSPYSLDFVFGKPGISFTNLWKRSLRAAYFGKSWV